MAPIDEGPDEESLPNEDDFPRDYSSELLDALADLQYGDTEIKSLARVFRSVANGDSGISFIYADSGVLKIQVSRDLRPKEVIYPELQLVQRLRSVGFSEDDLDRLGSMILEAIENCDRFWLPSKAPAVQFIEYGAKGILELTARCTPSFRIEQPNNKTQQKQSESEDEVCLPDQLVKRIAEPTFKFASQVVRDWDPPEKGEKLPAGLDEVEYFEAVTSVLLFGFMEMAKQRGSDFEQLFENAKSIKAKKP